MPNTVDLETLPVPMQGVPAPGYSAVDLRRVALAGQAQEGVIAGGDFKVTQRAAGPGPAVDVAAGESLVLGDSIAFQGLYYCLAGTPFTGNAKELTIAQGDPSNPRIDQVVLEIKDTQHDASGLTRGRVRVVPGTPTAGATLDNRLGAAALPASAVRLADIRVPANAVAIANADIRDRRPWARGARRTRVRSSGNLTVTSTTFVTIDAALEPRVECSGVPLEFKISGRVDAGGTTLLAPYMDGVQQFLEAMYVPGGQVGNYAEYTLPAPAAGSHVLSWFVRVATSNATVHGDATRPLQVTVTERVAQNADNA